jgi:truncated hemoglobin YjbI
MSPTHHPEPEHTAISSPPAGVEDFARVGGMEGVRAIIANLVDQMVDDVMIGFFFARTDRRKLKALEAAYAASHLGGPAYKGRDVAQVHRAQAIGRGHFLRRLRLMQEVLAQAQVPQDIAARWLNHQAALMPSFLAPNQACPERP